MKAYLLFIIVLYLLPINTYAQDTNWEDNIVYAEMITDYDSLIKVKQCDLVLSNQCLPGKSYVQFIITETGETKDFKVIKGLENCPESDSIAISVVKLIKFKAAVDKKQPVATQRILPIPFNRDCN